MILFKRAGDLAGWLEQQRATGRSIGFVPTMGALHTGHISLIDISKKTTSLTICSIFINPTQFNNPGDFQKYPITIEKDIHQLETTGVDALFLPEVTEMYPGGTAGLERYDLGPLETVLEGKFRPGHFQGVCQVMRRLLDLVRPDHLFMGQKDYQQCMVVRRLLELMGAATSLHPCPIIREADGLAMSSRNLRLTETERKNAPAIYRALNLLKEGGSVAGAKKILEDAEFRIDYVEVVDGETLMPLTDKADGAVAFKEGGDMTLQEGGDMTIKEGGDMTLKEGGAVAFKEGGAVALIAAFQGEIRLIDNMILPNFVPSF